MLENDQYLLTHYLTETLTDRFCCRPRDPHRCCHRSRCRHHTENFHRCSDQRLQDTGSDKDRSLDVDLLQSTASCTVAASC